MNGDVRVQTAVKKQSAYVSAHDSTRGSGGDVVRPDVFAVVACCRRTRAQYGRLTASVYKCGRKPVGKAKLSSRDVVCGLYGRCVTGEKGGGLVQAGRE